MMLSTLDSKDGLAYIRSLEYLSRYRGMYIDDNVTNIANFIDGMNFMTDGKLLDGFSDWLSKKYEFSSPWPWPILIEDISSLRLEIEFPSNLDFILNEIDLFLKERM